MKPVHHVFILVLFVDFQKLELSWGVDIEPAYTMVNIAFGW